MSQDLPIKISTPEYVFTVPSTKQKVVFRPYLVGEQKSMLLAISTEDSDTIINAIKNLIRVCSYDKVQPDKLASFDLEYLFLQLRAKSVGEHMQLTSKCSCGADLHYAIDVSVAEVDMTYTPDKKIVIDEKNNIGVVMKYPSFNQIIKLYEAPVIDDELLFETVVDCIDVIWHDETVISAKDYSQEAVLNFVNSIPIIPMEKLYNFVLETPSVKLTKTVPCRECKKENKILIEGLENFFD